MFEHDPIAARRGRLPALLVAVLLPGPLLAAAAAVVLARPRRLPGDEPDAIERLARIAAIVIAISAVMVVSSLLWFGLSTWLAPAAGPVKLGWGPHVRRLAADTATFAVELLVALAVCEPIEIFLARRRASTSPIVEFLSRNSLRLCLYVSFAATMQIVATLSHAIDRGFYHPLKMFMVAFVSSLYTAADQVARILRHARDLPSALDPDSEIAVDLLTTALSNPFAWIPVIAVWSAIVIAVDGAWLVARRLSRSLRG
jgi:energy-coupling factor transporter transmembrane protein EcfT